MEFNITNVDTVVMLWAAFDPLSWNITWGDMIETEFVGWYGHTDYFNDDNRENLIKTVNQYID